MKRRVACVDREAIERFLRVLFAAAPTGAWVEVRFRVGSGMRRSLHPVSAFDELTGVIATHTERRDVFVGVVARARRGGGRGDLVEQAAVVWADCDAPAAVAALADFEPRPSMIVASGGATNCHAYWLLSQPAEVTVIEQLNQRVALALGADAGSSDGARILRPGGSTNWKSRPPTSVRFVAVEPGARVAADELDARLPALAPSIRRGERCGGRVRAADSDPLLQITPRAYVEALTGECVGRDGKLRCPFHELSVGRPPTIGVWPAYSLADASVTVVEATVTEPGGERVAAHWYAGALFGRAPRGSLFEVRFRVPSGMGQLFHSASRLDRLVESILALSAHTDVYFGVLARGPRGGGRADVREHGGVVWADCDTSESVVALRAFRPSPAMVVASSAENCHAYWFLSEPVGLDLIERTNRRLALALGADVRCSDRARILRPAGSVNRKRAVPDAVRLLPAAADCVSVGDLDRALPPEPTPPETASRLPRRPIALRGPLESIPPPVFVERLTGQQVGRSGKVRCPFHRDRVPSLHVYAEPARGWYCFGCGRGGSI
jgi:RepB DNA-primase from phage plasmid/CHC2 zinc finger